MNTKDRILATALSMFSDRGYDPVSIRDICGAVGIKESTVYYHFKNKQDILDSLFIRFEEHVDSLLNVLYALHAPDTWDNSQSPSLEWIDTYFFEQYLLNPFCNKMMRLMLIEQLHNQEIQQKYKRWIFDEPYRIEMSVFEVLSQLGIMTAEEAEQSGKAFYAYITVLVFRYLLNGKLTAQKKKAFIEEAHSYIASSLGRLEVNNG